MLGNALGTAAGIRLAKKIEEQERKKKEEQLRKQEQNREDAVINSRVLVSKALRKDLSKIYSDKETIDFFHAEAMKGLRYLKVSFEFYKSTWRGRLFKVSKFSKIDASGGFNIEPLIQAVEQKKQRENEKANNKKEIKQGHEELVMSVNELHQQLLKELSVSEYKELFKLMRAEFESYK